MLPTPDFSHVAFERVYEPAEDTFLFLDTLSSAGETKFLHDRFGGDGSSSTFNVPVVVEVGPGSGVVIGFVNAHAQVLFGSKDVVTTAVDVNNFACKATNETARKAAGEYAATSGSYMGALQGDLVAPLRDGSVDVLIFNPPYVPTEELPRQPTEADTFVSPSFEDDSYLLSLSYAGGPDGLHTTSRLIAELPRILSPKGCAYILVCAQNKPDEVKQHIRDFGPDWRAEMVGSSGLQAGWEKLQIVRVWREL